MSRLLFRSVIAALAGGGLALTLVLALPRGEGIVVDLYLLFLGAIVVVNLIAATLAHHQAHPSSFDAALRRREPAPERPLELVRLESLVLLAVTRAFDYHHRLRPRLRELAAQRLSLVHGIDAQRDRERARSTLGDEAWDALREPDLPPSDRLAPGIGAPRLARVVRAIERIRP